MNASGPGEWITAAMVKLWSAAVSRKILLSFVAETESRPDVGSSRNRSLGSATMAFNGAVRAQGSCLSFVGALFYASRRGNLAQS